jgi:hypothetical protein
MNVIFRNANAPAELMAVASAIVEVWEYVAIKNNASVRVVHAAMKKSPFTYAEEFAHTGGNIFVSHTLARTNYYDKALLVCATDDSIEVSIASNPKNLDESYTTRYAECGEWSESLLLEVCA